MEPTTVEQPSFRAGCVRHIGPYTQIGQAFGRLGPIVAAAGLGTSARLIGIYYDDPAVTPAANLRSDAGILLPAGFTLPAGLTETILPAGRYAFVRHAGPYDTLPASWSKIKGAWLLSQDLRRREGPSYEVYLNTPMDAAPADLITDIFVPIA